MCKKSYMNGFEITVVLEYKSYTTTIFHSIHGMLKPVEYKQYFNS